MKSVQIIENASDNYIATWIGDLLSAALRASPGDVALNVPGGSTPFPIMEILAQKPLDWSRVAIWPGDDRVVPTSHDASNTGKIETIFKPVGAKVVPLSDDTHPPHFALTWLGMGADGHVASLFPNTNPQADDSEMVRRIVPDPLPPEAPFDRISLTIPALLNTDGLLIVIRSEEKRLLLDQALSGSVDLPISRLLDAATVDVTCFV